MHARSGKRLRACSPDRLRAPLARPNSQRPVIGVARTGHCRPVTGPGGGSIPSGRPETTDDRQRVRRTVERWDIWREQALCGLTGPDRGGRGRQAGS